jgi:hypothetical protein
VFSEDSYKNQAESGTEFLKSRRHTEKEILDEYLSTKEKDIAARTMQRDKATEERGGSTDDILNRPNQVWLPGPDYYFG